MRSRIIQLRRGAPSMGTEAAGRGQDYTGVPSDGSGHQKCRNCVEQARGIWNRLEASIGRHLIRDKLRYSIRPNFGAR